MTIRFAIIGARAGILDAQVPSPQQWPAAGRRKAAAAGYQSVRKEADAEVAITYPHA